MDELWKKAKTTNLVSHNEQVKYWQYAPKGNGTWDKFQVLSAADRLRKMLENEHPGQYSMSVSVKDRNLGGWRSGKFSPTSDPLIFVWSPEDYDKEFGDNQDVDFPELVAEGLMIYVRRIKPAKDVKPTRIKIKANNKPLSDPD